MREQATEQAGSSRRGRERGDYPLRDYVGDMARELADLARADGDEGLAALLTAAADRAEA